MNLVTYRPTEKSLFGFDKEWDRLVDSFFEGNLEGWNAPPVDVRETEDAYLLEMDVPGRSEKDLEVEVKDSVLTISSTQKEEKKEEKRNGYVLRERRASSFCRSFRLPEGVDAAKIDAAFKNGVLELKIPKAPEAKPHRVQIAAS